MNEYKRQENVEVVQFYFTWKVIYKIEKYKISSIINK